ncbi:MAG: ATP-binding cassette domain-containing protein [Flavonifractor plautii]
MAAIVGESGSGKSTLARVLSYVERPDGGRVFLDGLEVSACRRKGLDAVRGKVQLVMQNALGSLDPHQSVGVHSGGAPAAAVPHGGGGAKTAVP